MELIYVAWLVATLLCVACGVYGYLYWQRVDYLPGPDRGPAGPVSHHDHETLEKLPQVKQDMIEVTRCVWENQVPKCPFTR